jgi:O-antigen/teichoic acid export membrane protein
MLILARFVDSQALPAQFIRWNAVIILLDSLFLTTLTAFKAILRNTVNAVIEALSDALWLVATIVLVLWGVERVLPFLQTRFVIIALSVAVSFLVLRSLLKATASTATIRSALRQCLPYAASDMLTRLYMRADVLIVSLILGEYYVGIYSPAVSITNALFIIPATVHRVMIPLMSNLFAHNIPQARITARNNLVLMTAIGMVLSFGLYLSVWLLPFILGSDFAASQEVLRILSPIPLVHSLSFGMAGILVAANQQKNRSIIQGISALLNILLNLAVILWGGINAVAYVYLFSEIVLMLGYVLLLVRLDRHSKLFLD